MSAERQKRRTIAIAVVTLIIGVVFGFVVGRSTAPGVDDALADAQTRGRNLSAALQALPVEYEQAETGQAGETTAGIDDAIQRVVTRADDAVAATPWLGPAARKAVLDAVAAVPDAANAHASVQDF